MRKATALLLSLLMALSLAACGSQTTAEESTTVNEQTESTAPVIEETEQTEETTEAASETEAETLAFDTSWAGDEYVMPIPAPPVTNFEISEMSARGDGTAIQIFTQDVQDLTNDAVEEYRTALESLGFVNGIYERGFDSEHGYEFSAQNENGDTVYINCTSNYFILQFEFSE